MKALKVRENLFLAQQPVPVTETVYERKPVHHIWISDVSGSMWGNIAQLKQHVQDQLANIPKGDMISLAWFSTEGGEFGWLIIGRQINTEADVTALQQIVKDKLQIRGMTCFSEVLMSVPEVIENLKAFDNPVSLVFLSDGEPVTSNNVREMQKTLEALGKIAPKVATSMFVGYGPYYNRKTFSDMTKTTGGNFLHANRMDSVNIALGETIEASKHSEPRQLVELNAPPFSGIVFSIENGQMNFYQPDDKNRISYTPTKEGNNSIFFLTERPPIGVEEVSLDTLVGTGNGKNGKKGKTQNSSADVEKLLTAVYTASIVANKAGRQDIAIDTVAAIGDVALVDALDGAITNKELGAAEALIADAALFSDKRFVAGRKENYLPPPDAFCLLNAIEVLQQDQSAYVYPTHPSFVYSKIGPPAEVLPGYPKFERDPHAKSPIQNFVWNEELLNLSLSAQISGQVKLNDTIGADGKKLTPKSVGLANEYPCVIFRSYTLVEDGNLNMQQLPISCSKNTFQKLQSEGLIASTEKYKSGRVIPLQLDAVKIVNRAISEGKTSAREICELYYRDLVLSGELKALKYKLDELDPDKTAKKPVSLTDAQNELLTQNGVKNGIFSPPMQKAQTTDSYMAKSFRIVAKGFSSLPSVNKVLEKVKSGKAFTNTEALVNAGLELFKTQTGNLTSDKAKIAWLEETIKDKKSEQLTIRNEIAKRKFAILKGHKWFDEFATRAENTIEVDGINYTLEVGEKEVKF